MNNSPEKTDIKNRIQMFREYKNLSQDQLASDLGVSPNYVSKLENQHFTPSSKLMLKICRYFRAPLGEMFYIDK